MAKLKDEHKEFIVQALACFRSHTETIETLHATFEVRASLQQIYNLDPTKPANASRITQNLRDLFARTRADYTAHAESQPLAHPGYRLELLHDLIKRATKAGSIVIAAQLINQAKEEMGAIIAAKPVISTPHGSPGTAPPSLTDRERAARLLELLKPGAESGS